MSCWILEFLPLDGGGVGSLERCGESLGPPMDACVVTVSKCSLIMLEWWGVNSGETAAPELANDRDEDDVEEDLGG